MLQSYDDIIAIAREARRPIGWWDENGVPRFAVHHPSLCPDIYATEVALVVVACQACMREFSVQMSWSAGGEVWTRARAIADVARALDVGISDLPLSLHRPTSGLAGRIKDGTIHYGDPPHHDSCAAGVTMNVWDLHVLEFWSRNHTQAGYRSDWQRVPELEVVLTDAADIERAGETP